MIYECALVTQSTCKSEKFDWPSLCSTPEPMQYTAVEKGDPDKDLFANFEHSKFCRASNLFLYVDTLVSM